MPYPTFDSNLRKNKEMLHFRGNPYPTIGVELELQLVDPVTGGLKSGILPLLEEMGSEQRWMKAELMQSCVEVVTEVCHSVQEVELDLRGKLQQIQQAAQKHDLAFLWAGSHPFSHWRDQEITPKRRYRELTDLMQDTARRIVTFGMHVHIGVDSGDKAIMIIDRLMRYLPTLLALSANSPYWVGRKTGLHCQRVKILEQLPAAGTPPYLRNYSEYCWVVNQAIVSGFINSLQEIWWDVRPHPGFGTVEIRIFDLPKSLEDVLGLTALTQCLVTALSEQIDDGVYQHDIHPIVVQQNKWKACRWGTRAQLIDPVTHSGIPVRDTVFLLHDKLKPFAERLHCLHELNHIIAMVDHPSGAEEQLLLGDDFAGDLPEVVKSLIARKAF